MSFTPIDAKNSPVDRVCPECTYASGRPALLTSWGLYLRCPSLRPCGFLRSHIGPRRRADMERDRAGRHRNAEAVAVKAHKSANSQQPNRFQLDCGRMQAIRKRFASCHCAMYPRHRLVALTRSAFFAGADSACARWSDSGPLMACSIGLATAAWCPGPRTTGSR